MKIEIESTAGNLFIVKSDGKTSDELGWDELLGLVAALTIPDKKPCVHWMKDDVQEVLFEQTDEESKCKIYPGMPTGEDGSFLEDPEDIEELPVKRLLAIGKESLKCLKSNIDEGKLHLRGEVEKRFYHKLQKTTPDLICLDEIMDTGSIHPEDCTWLEWIQSIVDTLDDDDKLYFYYYND